MTFPIAPGQPAYSGTFIPQIWAGKLIENFYDATVLSAISNTDYEGEIKQQGDTVNIRTTPQVTIKKYTKGMNLALERPEAPIITLNIDKGIYYNEILDDVDKIQSDINLMSTWSADAGERMKIAVDQDVLGNIYTSVAAANQGATAGAKSGAFNLGVTGTPVALSKTNILDYIVDLGNVLDEQNVPEQGRWLLLPAWAAGMIKKSDLRNASITGDSVTILRNGKIGMIDRFTLFMSNNIASVTDGANKCYHILAGHKVGMTFASQMTNMESLRSESTFGTIVRGVQVYGYQVVKPEALARLYAYKS